MKQRAGDLAADRAEDRFTLSGWAWSQPRARRGIDLRGSGRGAAVHRPRADQVILWRHSIVPGRCPPALRADRAVR